MGQPLDIFCGLNPYLIRKLCDNPFDGGAGYTPHQVGDMTLDQAWMRLADLKVLRKDLDCRYTRRETLSLVGAGPIKGRAADGTPIKGIVRGKSKAAEIRERNAAKQQAAKRQRRKRRGS